MILRESTALIAKTTAFPVHEATQAPYSPNGMISSGVRTMQMEAPNTVVVMRCFVRIAVV